MGYQSETAKQRQHTEKYCQGAGVDIASQGDPVVPWAWQLELPPDRFAYYNSGKPYPPVQLSGFADKIPVNDGSLDFVYSSHFLEDCERSFWPGLLKEWARCIKPGGHLVILVPDNELWNYAVNHLGQPPNCSHTKPEPVVGELSSYAEGLGLEVVEDRLTSSFENDYSILFVGRKKA